MPYRTPGASEDFEYRDWTAPSGAVIAEAVTYDEFWAIWYKINSLVDTTRFQAAHAKAQNDFAPDPGPPIEICLTPDALPQHIKDILARGNLQPMALEYYEPVLRSDVVDAQVAAFLRNFDNLF